jgi:hypothetical protein
MAVPTEVAAEAATPVMTNHHLFGGIATVVCVIGASGTATSSPGWIVTFPCDGIHLPFCRTSGSWVIVGCVIRSGALGRTSIVFTMQPLITQTLISGSMMIVVVLIDRIVHLLFDGRIILGDGSLDGRGGLLFEERQKRGEERLNPGSQGGEDGGEERHWFDEKIRNPKSDS